MDVLASALSAFGPLIICCIAFYLRWQLADETPATVALRSTPTLGTALNDGTLRLSEGPAAPGIRGCAAGVVQRPELVRAAGVYVAGHGQAEAVDADAMILGQLLADRVVSGRFQARRAPRRGKKGALDVIVVGANTVGVSATLHLMEAGLRVLLVDREAPAPLDHPSLQPLLRSLFRKARNARLPLLTGHSISAVSERADGMLEVEAERAAWYAANVIFATTDGPSLPGSLASAGSRAA
jgi:hypothetical protein